MSMQNSYVSGALVLIALIISGCNGQEDFSDAILGGPIIDSTIPDPNFDPTDPCSPRVVGNLIDGGTVKNIGFTCGGFFGNTGETGLEDEQSQNRFVCPLNSTSVTFYIGGETARVPIGSGAFRRAVSQNLNADGVAECQFNTITETYDAGGYDADGPYLYAVADLFDGPARSDVVSHAAENKQIAQNISALLLGLDADVTDDVVAIHNEANRLVFDSEVTFPDFDVPFVSFVDSAGLAQNFLDTIDDAFPGVVGLLPVADTEVQARLVDANGRTAAGIYRFDLLYKDYINLYLAEQGPDASTSLFNAEALLSDLLKQRLQEPEMVVDPEDTSTVDLVTYTFEDEYLPYVLIDRSGRIIGGGAFDVARYVPGNPNAPAPEDQQARIDRLCDEQPLYLTFNGGASLAPNLQFASVEMAPISSPGEVAIKGRFIDGVAYSGVKAPSTEGAPTLTDYEFAYTAPTHTFDAATDGSTLATDLCGSNITKQIFLNNFRRQGLVMPELDSVIMNALFTTPAIYELDYLARAVANDPDPNTSVATSRITVHQDGTIMTDISGDGNVGLAPGIVPPGEYVIGMVSSVIAGNSDPLSPLYISDAKVNIIVFNYGPSGTEVPIKKYGSHFRARLLQETACNTEVLVSPSNVAAKAFWFDAYDITTWLRSTNNPTHEQKYEALRTKAYGFITGKRLDCTPPP